MTTATQPVTNCHARATWDRELDNIPAARPYMDELREFVANKCPAIHAQMIMTVSTACVVRARHTGSPVPLVYLGMYLRSWGMDRETAQRFCRRMWTAMDALESHAERLVRHVSSSQPDPREVRAVFGDGNQTVLGDEPDALTLEELDDLVESGLTLEEWLHPEAARRREQERLEG